MELTINYGGVNRSPALEDHIKYNLERIGSKLRLDRSDVRVWLNKESALLSSGPPEFSTKIQVKKPGKSELMAEAKSSHLAESVSRAADRIKKRILKNKKGGPIDQKTQRSIKRNRK